MPENIPDRLTKELLSTIEKSVPSDVSSQPNPQYEDEQKFLESARARVNLASDWHDLTARKKYSRYVFWLVVMWIAFTIFAVTASAIGELWIPFYKHVPFKIPSNVLATMVAGVAANIIGLLVVICKYLFQPKS